MKNGKNKEDTHAHCNCDNKSAIGNRRHQLCKNLQIRFGHSYDDTQQQAEQDNQPHFFTLRHFGADLLAHWRHGHFRTKGKEHHSHHYKERTHKETQQYPGRYGRHCKAQNNDYNDDGNNCSQCLGHLTLHLGIPEFQLITSWTFSKIHCLIVYHKTY